MPCRLLILWPSSHQRNARYIFSTVRFPFPSFHCFAASSKIKLKSRMENLTASEIAGFGVGTLLLCATIAATKVDAFISSSQRSSHHGIILESYGSQMKGIRSPLKLMALDDSLGMCKRCGDLRMIACSRCKGVRSAKKGGPFSFIMLEEISEALGDGRTQKQLTPCINCQSKGRLPCPNCLKLS
ncbi:uncharacterized protein LOC122041047 isoform X1 [Zingiber officinale]|uniref:uncharacterized protein LOC122041047 isoform X1 n=1 Tax=Zingiber officinale TaxID=94328 RepID=UPI001C4B072A|nr:uncharacterized protein LOC122041047 isoform X1 [Zingiber officinale]